MRIEHIAIWTNDLEKMKEFYTGFFNGEAGERYCNSKNSFESYFLKFDSGVRLEIMKKPDVLPAQGGENIRFTGYTHIAFSVGSKEEVDSLTERIRSAGYCVISEVRLTGDGYYESCILDPDGNIIEITV